MRLNEEQRRLAEQHCWVAEAVASRMAKACWSAGVSRDEAISAGLEAVCNAALRCDPSRPDSFRGYAYTAAMNRVRNLITAQDSRRQKGFGVALPDDSVLLAEERPEPEHGDVVLSDLVSRLDDRSRRIIERHYQGGELIREIGQGLGLTASRVRQLRALAVRRLRTLAGCHED